MTKILSLGEGIQTLRFLDADLADKLDNQITAAGDACARALACHMDLDVGTSGCSNEDGSYYLASLGPRTDDQEIHPFLEDVDPDGDWEPLPSPLPREQLETRDEPDPEALAEQHGGIWSEHPKYKVADWLYEVANGDTRAGYWAWVATQIDME